TLPGAVGLFEQKTLTERRVRMIADYQSGEARFTASAGLAILGLAGLFAFNPVARGEPNHQLSHVADTFLQLVHESRYGESWDYLSQGAKELSTRTAWINAMSVSHPPYPRQNIRFGRQASLKDEIYMRTYLFDNVEGVSFTDFLYLIREGRRWKLVAIWTHPTDSNEARQKNGR
ncbi:MAG: hypothetical protein AAF492_19025, partial [Verrucomicrobiota bacterium]